MDIRNETLRHARPKARLVMLDTNVWRSVVELDRLGELRSLERSGSLRFVACPAVLYEVLRTPHSATRLRLLDAVLASSAGW